MIEWTSASCKNERFGRNNIIQEEIKDIWNFYILRRKYVYNAVINK